MGNYKRDWLPRTHPRHEGGPCKAYDPDSLPGKGPKEIRAEMGIPEPKRPATGPAVRPS